VDEESLRRDTLLLESLRMPGRSPKDSLAEALERAVARQTLLSLSVRVDNEDRTWYFPNTDRGRRAVARFRAGIWNMEDVAIIPETDAQPETQQNIFSLYEQNIGLLQPLIAEELREAEEDYPREWIERAFRIAAQRNVRHWRYVQAILKRWASKGMDNGEDRGDTEEEWRRRIEQQFRDSIE